MAVAIVLFNDQGTAAISTNPIAQAAAISLCNLYYHFRNKEQIIQAIFAQLISGWRAASALPADRPPQLADLFHVVRANFAVVWHYRFHYRELPALMLRDPVLAAQYQALRAEIAMIGYLLVIGVKIAAPGTPPVSAGQTGLVLGAESP